MPRPRRQRRVRGRPNSYFFKPAGVRKVELEDVVLDLNEFEAIRLKDFLGLEQNECAGRMEISQPTFHRLLAEARKKVASVIVEGKVLRISE